MRKHFFFILQHRAGVRFYTSSMILQNLMFLLNSRSSLVTATRLPRVWHPFSRSYGANLPNALARILADTPWASHPGAPVSDLGTSRSCRPRLFTDQPHREKSPCGDPVAPSPGSHRDDTPPGDGIEMGRHMPTPPSGWLPRGRFNLQVTEY